MRRIVNRTSAPQQESEARSAFAALVARHELYVRNMLAALCRHSGVADELAQETFLTVWLRLDTLRNPERFRPWLKQLAYRQFLGHARRAKVEAAYTASLPGEPSVDLGWAEDLVQLLDVCTQVEREMIVLSLGFGFTAQELAQTTEVPVGTVKSHLHRAKQKMREHMQRSLDHSLGAATAHPPAQRGLD